MKEVGSGGWETERVGRGRRARAPDFWRSEKFNANGHLSELVLAQEGRPGTFRVEPYRSFQILT